MNFVVKPANASVPTINVTEKGIVMIVATRQTQLAEKTVVGLTFGVIVESVSIFHSFVMEMVIVKMVAMRHT